MNENLNEYEQSEFMQFDEAIREVRMIGEPISLVHCDTLEINLLVREDRKDELNDIVELYQDYEKGFNLIVIPLGVDEDGV